MEEYIPMITPSECRKIWLRDINYIKKLNRQVIIECGGKSYYLYEKFDDVIRYLGPAFYGCLKGTYINFDRVEAMHDRTIFFNGGGTLKLGRDSYIKARQTYAFYLKNPCNYIKNNVK